MTLAEEIRAKLERAFAPRQIEVIDESAAHRGHAGYRDGGESHFRVVMRAEALAGLSRIERHRAVHATLGPDLVARIHALALDLGA
jgi:BolA protein